HQSDTQVITVKMEILLEPTSNKLMVGDLCDSIRIKLVTTGKKRCEQIPSQKKKILGVDQLTEDPSSSGQKDLVIVKSSANDTKVTIPGVERPWLSEAEGFILPNHDTGRILLAESQRNTTDPSVAFKPKRLILNGSKEVKHFKPKRKPIWYLDSGCSRHMTGVKSCLHKHVEQPGPKVVFGDDSTCTNKGYGSIKCNGIFFIKFDEKRRTIFNTNKEIVMIAPRVRDVYVLDMTSSAQESCFFGKAFENLNWLWNKRLAHLNFKTINKLYSRYTWEYFLKKKSQAPETIMSFIKRVENQNDIKVKQLRTDNGTEFKNSILVNFYDEKGVSQNFSSPYTPEQNGVAERKNRTLIEAARTMLSGSVFSKQYCNEVVATACYTQNRSTIVKRHLKTPYEIFYGRIPNIDFLHVFGCPVYIHKHKDYLGKFDEKADDGYFLGYSLVSKAFRVFNTRKQQTEETYHITFDESTHAIKFSKPLVDNINIAESERYLPHEYNHHYEPSQKYQVNNNEVSFIDPYESLDPVVLETEAPSDQNDQSDHPAQENDHPAQQNDFPNNNPLEYSNHNNNSPIIENLINAKVVQDSEPTSSPVEDASVQNLITILNITSSSIPSTISPVAQDIWSQDKHIELVNIIGV
ncbi:retrovirus-related pol polyprotein from transposon TNT 1-94, partial [Tanacetum coccineum]